MSTRVDELSQLEWLLTLFLLSAGTPAMRVLTGWTGKLGAKLARCS